MEDATVIGSTFVADAAADSHHACVFVAAADPHHACVVVAAAYPHHACVVVVVAAAASVVVETVTYDDWHHPQVWLFYCPNHHHGGFLNKILICLEKKEAIVSFP
jgi:hypothetical protein